jgi:SAM-dependent methyltransferase
VLRPTEAGALDQVREFLAETAYAYMANRLIPGHGTVVFPSFEVLHGAIQPLRGIYRLLFTVFLEGHPATEEILRRALPSGLFEAFESTGLLVPDRAGEWRTPGLALVAAEGMLLAVSLPPHYPTASSRSQPIYIGIESLWLARALPPRLDGRRVLDVCAGSGVQGLICAARGAASVTALELQPGTVDVSRFNAALNGLTARVEVRCSDLFGALRPHERFDFFVCNPPFMPVMEDVDYPLCGAGGADGMAVTRRIVDGLPRHLAAGGSGVMFVNALGSRRSVHFNHEVLEPMARREGLFIRAHIDDKQPMADYIAHTLTGNLINTCPGLSAGERDAKIAAWLRALADRGVPADMVYGELIRIRRAPDHPGLAVLPAYDPRQRDPLVSRAREAAALP